MTNIRPYRNVLNPARPPSEAALTYNESENLTSLGAGTAAASAVALGVSGAALKTGVVAAGTGVSLAAWSPLYATLAVGLVGLDLLTGFPVTQALFAAAAFVATRWGVKKLMSESKAVADAVGTVKKLGASLFARAKNLVVNRRPAPVRTTRAVRPEIPASYGRYAMA